MASRRFDPELLLIGKLVRLLESRSRDSALRIARYLADRFSGIGDDPRDMPVEPTAEPTPLPLFPADIAGTVHDDPDLLRSIVVNGAMVPDNASTSKSEVPF